METTQIIQLVTILVTWLLGVISKRCEFINNKMIPMQNLIIGIVVAIIEYIITKDFEVSIAVSGLLAGGSYDFVHNLDKLLNGDNKNV